MASSKKAYVHSRTTLYNRWGEVVTLPKH